MKKTRPSMVFFSRDLLYNAKQNFHGENNNEHQTCVGWLSEAKMASWCLSLQFLKFITIVFKNKKTCNLDLSLVWMVYHSMGLRNEKGTPHQCLGAKNHLFFCLSSFNGLFTSLWWSDGNGVWLWWLSQL